MTLLLCRMGHHKWRDEGLYAYPLPDSGPLRAHVMHAEKCVRCGALRIDAANDGRPVRLL